MTAFNFTGFREAIITFLFILILSKDKSRGKKIKTRQQENSSFWTEDLIDEDNRTTFVNNKLCEILGYNRDEMMEKDIYLFMDDGARQIAIQLMQQKKEGNTDQLQIKYISKSRKEVWTHISSNPLFDEKGIYKGSLAMVTDITEQRIAAEKLEKLNKELACQIQEKETRAFQLSLSNKELIRINKELDRFVYSVSHDLRSPLTSILGLVSFIEEDSREPDTLEQVKMSLNRNPPKETFGTTMMNHLF